MTAIAHPASSTSRDESRGMLLGLAGVAMFSLTMPFTRMAVMDLDPLFAALARALGAAALAAGWLSGAAPRCRHGAPGCLLAL